MKQYIKDNKIYNTPVEIKTKDKIYYTTDEKLILKNGYAEYKVEVKPSLEELIAASNEAINKETDEKILNGFVWDGNEFYLTLENQFNFKNIYDLRDIQEYPITVKTKTGFANIDSPSELSGFYFSGVQFVTKCVTDGWQKKIRAEEKIRAEYEN